MRTLRRIAFPVILAAALIGFSVAEAAPRLSAPQASATSFHFVFAADSRGNYTVLPIFSHKMVTLSPVFGFFAGDLCTSFDTTCINGTWKPAMDGNNHDGMLARTFVSRGNHDSGSLSTWQGLWDFAGMATRVGVTHYVAQTTDATYSFDYGNSHFDVIDNPSSGAAGWTSTQISWLDQDLTAAESRGDVHEFLISHGPMYTVTTEHAGDLPSSSLKAVLNKHPRLIGFHGHEHVTAYTLVTPSFESGINAYRQFTLGRAGAPAYPISKPVTWSANQNAFADVNISDSKVIVTVYSQSGAAIYSKIFTDGSGTTPTATPAPSGGTVTDASVAAYDGQILESTSTSLVGGAIDAGGATFRLGDDASNRQYRDILSFDTSGLPDTSTIKSVTLKIRKAGAAGSNPFSTMGNIAVDMMKGAFSNSVALQAADYQASASKSAAFTITNNPVNSWFSVALSSTNFAYVNKTGVTQFRLRFATPSNNNGVADYITLDTGNHTTTSYRPLLVITYTVP